jgi:signal peptidase I
LDIIVFDYPKEAVKYTENTNIYLIKRIIGLPGETLNIKDGKVTVINKEHPEGIIIPDNFVIDSHRTNENLDITLGPTEYYVMGDNRANSLDSRKWGPLEEKYIVGRPILRLLPFSKIGILPGK